MNMRCLIIVIFAAIGFSLGCEELSNILPKSSCGKKSSVAATFCEDTTTTILLAHVPGSRGQAVFIFDSPEWLDTTKICSKEHMKAYYQVRFAGDGLDALKNLEVKGKVLVGLMPYEIPLKWTGAKFEATDNDIGLDGWGPFSDAGFGTVWSQVVIKFDSTNDGALDIQLLSHVLRFVGVAYEYYLPKTK